MIEMKEGIDFTETPIAAPKQDNIRVISPVKVSRQTFLELRHRIRLGLGVELDAADQGIIDLSGFNLILESEGHG